MNDIENPIIEYKKIELSDLEDPKKFKDTIQTLIQNIELLKDSVSRATDQIKTLDKVLEAQVNERKK